MKHKPDDLMTVKEIAAAIGRERATVFNLARDHNLPRYRLPARGRTTFLRWGDVQVAMATPIMRERRQAPEKDPQL